MSFPSEPQLSEVTLNQLTMHSHLLKKKVQLLNFVLMKKTVINNFPLKTLWIVTSYNI